MGYPPRLIAAQPPSTCKRRFVHARNGCTHGPSTQYVTDFYALSLTIFASQDSRIYCEGSGQDDFGGVLRVATAVGEVPTGL